MSLTTPLLSVLEFIDSTSTSQVQFADVSAVLATGVITSTLHIQDYWGILRYHVARLDPPPVT